ncbi:hypothetical protein ACFXON_24980, partial [Bacillus subtilis]
MTEISDSRVNTQREVESPPRPPLLARLSIGRFAGLYLLIALVVTFSLTDPRFATAANFRVVAASQAIAGILTLGLVVSLISGVFD